MRLYSENKDYKLYQGNMLDMLEVIEPNSIDSIVTDPPYELGFMGKSWDSSGIAFQKETWRRCFQVLKPGGHLLAFGGSRTFHRIACAIEDAGFEIRDTILYLYGSGFPKSMNIGLAIDKKNGVDNKTGNIRTDGKATKGGIYNCSKDGQELHQVFEEREAQNEWKGWGTQLKPAYEPIIVARKPFKGSLVDNVLKYRVGGINIDECRVETDEKIETGRNGRTTKPMFNMGELNNNEREYQEKGRFPSNLIHDNSEEATRDMPIGKKNGSISKEYEMNNIVYGDYKHCNTWEAYDDEGSASRYFKSCEFSEKDIFDDIPVGCTPIIMARKPVEGSIIENVEKYGVGGINIDECRVGDETISIHNAPKGTFAGGDWDRGSDTESYRDSVGRFPANVIHDGSEYVVKGMPYTKTGSIEPHQNKADAIVNEMTSENITSSFDGDEGSASRYFYCAKASKKDRDEGLDSFEEKQMYLCDGSANSLEIFGSTDGGRMPRKNIHPTVKPTELMQYLVRLVTPNGGTVLDPFNGSGSTGKAVMFENKEKNKGYKYIGIELTEEYLPISKARIEYVIDNDFVFTPDENNRTTHEEIKKDESVEVMQLW